MKKLMYRRRTGESKKKGFTLVELIVVLVILALLAAILVPALIGWIQKSKEKSVILECRQCVMAAQAIATERYGSGAAEAPTLNDDKDEILTLAEVSDRGDVTTLDYAANKVSVKRLVYKQNNSDLTVTYENGEYTVGESNNTMMDQNYGVKALGTIAQIIADSKNTVNSFFTTMDSGAIAADGTAVGTHEKAAAFVKQLKDSNINVGTNDMKSWKFTTDGGKGMLYWSDQSIIDLPPGTVIPVMRYNYNTGTYTVWKATIQNNGEYNIYQNFAGYSPSTGQASSNQTYENMVKMYNQAKGEMGLS